MRFHIGCSFRPKQIIKYLFPFLLGLLAMFGIDQVNATYDDSYTFEYNISILDESTQIPGINYTIESFNDFMRESGLNYETTIWFYRSSGDLMRMRVYFTKETPAWKNRHFANWTNNSDYYTSTWSYLNAQPYQYDQYGYGNNMYRLDFDLFVGGANANTTQLSYLLNYINNNITTNLTISNWNRGYQMFDATWEDSTLIGTIPSIMITPGGIDNYTSIIYDCNYDILLDNNDTNNQISSASYSAKLIINGLEIVEGGKIPTYKDLQNMGNLDFESVSPQFPYVYFSMNKTQMSSFNANFTFKPLIDSDTYLSLIGGGQQKYYGRYNHNNYYTYEPINCTLSRSGSVDDSTGIITFTYNNFSCFSDLTNYDKIYIFESTGYEYDLDNLYNHTIIATLLKSNVDSMLSDKYLGTLYEKLDLQYGWKVLFSSYDFPMRYAYFRASQPNVLFEFLNNNDSTNDIVFDSSGDLIGRRSYSLWFPDYITMNIDSRYNLMTIAYDDIANHNSGNTIFEYWFEWPEYVLVSFPTIIDNKDNYVFYDNTGNIVNNNIQTNYGLNNLGSYDLNESFKVIDSFFDEIKEPMIQLHNINQSVYDIAPDFIKLFLLILYLLFLNSILFKIIRR